jgi:hypothetical protein
LPLDPGAEFVGEDVESLDLAEVADQEEFAGAGAHTDLGLGGTKVADGGRCDREPAEVLPGKTEVD